MTARQTTRRFSRGPLRGTKSAAWTFSVGAAAAVAALTIVYPIGCLLYRAFHSPAGWTLAEWRALAASPFTGAAVLNTLAISLTAAALSVAVGGSLAVVSARARFPGRAWLRVTMASPLFVSQSVMAIAWVLLAERQGGLLNVLLRAMGAPAAFEALSLGGIVFVTVLVTLPLSFFVTEGLASNIDAELEEAAFVCGAGPAATARRVLLPLLAPGLGAAALLCFMLSNVMFSVQGLLGMPKSVWTLANLVYFRLGEYPPNLGGAAAVALALLLAGLFLTAAKERLLSTADHYVVSGRPRAGLWALPRWAKAACLAATAALFLVMVALPYGALALRSLAPHDAQVQAGAGALLRGWTLEAYRALSAEPAMRRALVNSLALAACSAVLGVALAFVLGYHAARTRGLTAAAIQGACVAPFAFSGMVLGLAFIIGFSAAPLALYGTLWLLLAAYVARELAPGFKLVQAGLEQIPPELEDAAFVCGAGIPRMAARILVPLLAPSLLAVAALAFMASFREIEASVLLAGPGREVFGYQVFTGFQNGTWKEISAMAVAGAGVCALAAAAALAAARRVRGSL